MTLLVYMFSDDYGLQGFFTGTYNGISGKIKRESTGEVLYTISGKWSDIAYIQKNGSNDKKVFFDVNELKITPKMVKPEEEQEEFESRRFVTVVQCYTRSSSFNRVWQHVTKGLKTRNMDLATAEKTRIEENQRSRVKERHSKAEEWHPRFFDPDGDDFVPNFT